MSRRFMMSYAARLRDPRWQRRRLEIMNRDQFRCRACLAAHLTLNVHHAYYLKWAMPWEYPDAAYVTLCEGCHLKAERRRQEILEMTADPHRQALVRDFARSLRNASQVPERAEDAMPDQRDAGSASQEENMGDDIDDEDIPF